MFSQPVSRAINNCILLSGFCDAPWTCHSRMAELVKSSKSFGGSVRRYKHESSVQGCPMMFHVYVPPAAEHSKVPVVLYLSGLTCTDENFMQKAGAQREAAELGLALVSPDTSPRGVDVPGAGDAWDFGFGAGFYLDATREPYSKNFRMYDYITKELPDVLRSLQELDMERVSLMGHSMGGHGALTIGLKSPTAYKSVSAFSAICNPSQVPWGQKALTGYLGEDKEQWRQYDATLLAEAYSGPSSLPILMDTGTDDEFLKIQLHPWVFEKAIEGKVQLTSRMQEGYDHSYFFISTFVADHLHFHAKHLQA